MLANWLTKQNATWNYEIILFFIGENGESLKSGFNLQDISKSRKKTAVYIVDGDCD